MTLLCGEDVSRRSSEAVRIWREVKQRKGKGKRQERKNLAAKRRSGAAAETDAGVQTQKSPEVFLPQDFVKTATTYSPTCAVPSA